MGACFSLHDSSDDPSPSHAAKVVSVSGDLHEYFVPASVSLVLQAEIGSSSSSLNLFLCNSDCLNYDEYIPAMDSAEKLQPNQLYFVLPVSKLQHLLSSQDMAALAVKASVALQKKDSSRRPNKARISPVLLVPQPSLDEGAPQTKVETFGKPGKPVGLSRSRSGRKFQKLTSRRARPAAVRSFRLRLSTIHEGSVLQNERTGNYTVPRE